MLAMTMTASLPVLAPAQRDVLWDHSRNSLGIARLLVHEGRPEPLVATACHTAVEAACRAALEQAGLRYDGDVAWGLVRLAAPRDLAEPGAGLSGAARLQATERIVAWLAAYLRHEAPERSWGY
jgi:hypothetical protein